jgi:hypothetical protein
MKGGEALGGTHIFCVCLLKKDVLFFFLFNKGRML